MTLTLFHTGSDTTYSMRGWGGGIYALPMISRKIKVFAQFLLHTHITTKNRLTQKKKQVFISKKQKNGGCFKIREEEFFQYFAFFTSSHKNGSSSANFGARPLNLFANEN